MKLQPRRALKHASVVAAAAAISGLGSYALVVLAARGTDPEAYSSFAVFWSLAVVAGLGLYYPVEQETAREVAGDGQREGRGLARTVGLTAAGITVLAAVVTLVLLTPAGVKYIGDPGLVPALLAVLVASAVQFPVRGLLSGGARRERYALVIGTEGAFRIILPGLLVLVGLNSAVPYAFAVAAAALFAVLPAFVSRDLRWLHRPTPRASVIMRKTLALIVAALAIQLLLNSPVLIAGAVAAATPFAGGVLASLTIARIPVFVYGIAQVLYMPSVARFRAAGDRARLRGTIILGLGGAAATACAIALVMAIGGEWIVSVLFGPSQAIAQPAQVLIGLGVGVFFLAQVTSDTALALGAHRSLVRSWVFAIIVGGVALAIIPDPLLRTAVPLLLGATLAVAQLVVIVVMELRRVPVARSGEPR